MSISPDLLLFDLSCVYMTISAILFITEMKEPALPLSERFSFLWRLNYRLLSAVFWLPIIIIAFFHILLFDP